VELKELKSNIIDMAREVEEIIDLISKGFIENKSEYLDEALDKEKEVNILEKSLTKGILNISRQTFDKDFKEELVVLSQVIESLERMGDECAGLIERIEIKIQEKLLFPDIGVEEFNEVYNMMKVSVAGMIKILRHPKGEVEAKEVISNGFKIKDLIERYRKAHAERLVKGMCDPRASNMYFDMLDFTGNIARHSSNIVKTLIAK